MWEKPLLHALTKIKMIKKTIAKIKKAIVKTTEYSKTHRKTVGL